MKVFKSWWKRRTRGEKFWIVLATFILSFIPMCLLFGLKGFVIVVCTIVTVFGLVFLVSLLELLGKW